MWHTVRGPAQARLTRAILPGVSPPARRRQESGCPLKCLCSEQTQALAGSGDGSAPPPSPSGVASVAPRPRTRAGRAHMSTLKAGEAAGVRVTPEVGQSVGFPRRLRIRGKCRACHAFGTRGTPAVDRTPSTDALDQQPPRLLGDARHWHYSDASACTLGKKATVTCRYCERDVRRDVLSRHRQSKSCQEKQRLYAVGGA